MLLEHARPFQLELDPGHFHVMLDARQVSPQAESLFLNLQAAGVDSFLLSSEPSFDKTNLIVMDSHQCPPLSERSTAATDCRFKLWQLPESDPDILIPTTDPKKEAFLIFGEDCFVVHSMNKLLPPGANCLWKPPTSTQLQLLSRTQSPISLWRLRSNPGILGIVFSWENAVTEPDDLGAFSARLRKLRQPCSAMDYPPTIYMIGEDEER